MLAEQTDFVIGVDTHRDRHSAAILASSGGLVDETSASADQGGYSMLLRWAQCDAAGRRVWAIEGPDPTAPVSQPSSINAASG